MLRRCVCVRMLIPRKKLPNLKIIVRVMEEEQVETEAEDADATETGDCGN